MNIKEPGTVYEATKQYRRKRQEHFVVLTLRGDNSIIKTHTVTIGTVNKTIVHPREVFYPAIKDNAVSIILVHNHPSGSVTPSQEDREITDRLKRAGELLGIQVLDHVIISKVSFYSFLQAGVF